MVIRHVGVRVALIYNKWNKYKRQMLSEALRMLGTEDNLEETT